MMNVTLRLPPPFPAGVALLKTVFRLQGLLALRRQRINPGRHDLGRHRGRRLLPRGAGCGSFRGGGNWRERPQAPPRRTRGTSFNRTVWGNPWARRQHCLVARKRNYVQNGHGNWPLSKRLAGYRLCELAVLAGPVFTWGKYPARAKPRPITSG